MIFNDFIGFSWVFVCFSSPRRASQSSSELDPCPGLVELHVRQVPQLRLELQAGECGGVLQAREGQEGQGASATVLAMAFSTYFPRIFHVFSLNFIEFR